MHVLKFKLDLFVQSDFIVALATIHRSAFSGLERYFGLLTALSARYREHLASGTIAIVSVTLCFPGFAAGGTTLGLVGIAPGLEELLFLSAEGEVSPTIGALESLVFKTHWMTSSLVNSWLELRSSKLKVLTKYVIT
jgi:hypothetical protein